MSKSNSGKCRSIRIELQTPIAAPQKRVWKALVRETWNWWPHQIVMNPKARRIVIEARLGGRVLEDWGGGGGLVWWNVVGLRTGSWLELAGQMLPEMGGPATSLARILLKPDGKRTTIDIVDCLYGALEKGMDKPIRGGWKALMEALKAYAEKPTSARTTTRPRPRRRRR